MTRFLSYCTGNINGTIEEQVNGIFEHIEYRLGLVGLTLEYVVQMDCLFKDIKNIPVIKRHYRTISKEISCLQISPNEICKGRNVVSDRCYCIL